MSAPRYFVLSASDNGSYWIDDHDASDTCCPQCNSKLSRKLSAAKFYLKKKSYDASYTYDGFLIVTQRLLNDVSRPGIRQLVAEPLPEDKRYTERYFVVDPLTQLTVDRSDSRLHIGALCELCSVPMEVSGPPGIRILTERIESGVFRTDIEFGSGFEKSPYVVIGVETAEKMKRSKYRGVHLHPVL